MNIMHIVYSGLGGHGSVLFSYLRDSVLKSAKHHVLFFGVEKVKTEYLNKCNDLNLTNSYVEKSKWLFFLKLFKEFKKHKPDKIIIHSLPCIVPAIFYKLFNKCSIIIVDHTSDNHKKADRKIFLWLLLANIFCEKNVYLTSLQLNQVKNQPFLFHRKKKSIIIPNGINTELFSPKATNKPNEKFTIIAIGRIIPEKQIKTIIKAVSNLKHLDIYLEIAGNGIQTNELISYRDSLNLQDKIEFLGHLKENEIISLMQSASILVNASKSETMSTSIIQALSCGLPVVLSNIEENKLLIENNKHGVLFSDVESLTKTITELYQNDEKLKILSKNATIHARKNYSDVTMINRYYKLIKE